MTNTKSSSVLIVSLLAFYLATSAGSSPEIQESIVETDPQQIGVLQGDPLERIHISAADFRETGSQDAIRYIGKTKYLNNARAVVTHTIDDSTSFAEHAIDAADKYGIKLTAFVNTVINPKYFPPQDEGEFWSRLGKAVADGHEIGSHSRTHPCSSPKPDTKEFCSSAYSTAQLEGSRDDILKHTSQPYVWAFAYPCGNCADWKFIQDRVARAGYLVARNYPGELQGRNLVPNLQTYAPNVYDASYTEVVQKPGGFQAKGRTDVAEINTKFDQVYGAGGIYSFLSHPQWLDYGPDSFYEKHLAHIGRRRDVWYVPMGPLYAYHTIVEQTQVQRLKDKPGSLARFAVYNNLDPKVFGGSITLQFQLTKHVSAPLQVFSGDQAVPNRASAVTDRWNEEYVRQEVDRLYLTVRPNTVLNIALTAGQRTP